jgi:hypothetical protein
MFLVVELTHLSLNLSFGMSVTYLRLIILLVVVDVLIDSNVLLVTNFINLKIKSTQSFKYTHTDRVCVHVFIGGVLIHV